MSQEQRFSLYEILSRISHGRAVGELGQLEQARDEMLQGLNEARTKGVGFMRPMMDSWLADVYARSNENQRALSIVDQALVNVDEAAGRSWEAELHRQRAQILLSLTPSRVIEAEVHLKKAVEVARRQHAKSLELRAATSLAELWLTQNRGDEARDLLGPVCDWFEEGADTVDLKRARDLKSALR